MHNTGAAAGNTCTLAQAINKANATGSPPFSAPINIAIIGSKAALTPGNCTVTSNPSDPVNFDITFDAALPATIVLDSVDNYWYGPNALPPIATPIAIIGSDAGTTLQAVHAGDPTPGTVDAFRFFYVSGGLDGEIHDNTLAPAGGSLTLQNIVLQGGYAKGAAIPDTAAAEPAWAARSTTRVHGEVLGSRSSLIGNVAQGGQGVRPWKALRHAVNAGGWHGPKTPHPYTSSGRQKWRRLCVALARVPCYGAVWAAPSSVRGAHGLAAAAGFLVASNTGDLVRSARHSRVADQGGGQAASPAEAGGPTVHRVFPEALRGTAAPAAAPAVSPLVLAPRGGVAAAVLAAAAAPDTGATAMSAAEGVLVVAAAAAMAA